MMERKCHWYIRWWHKRLRSLDQKFMLPKLSNFPSEIWLAFTEKEGQEHWHCNCAEGLATEIALWIQRSNDR